MSLRKNNTITPDRHILQYFTASESLYMVLWREKDHAEGKPSSKTPNNEGKYRRRFNLDLQNRHLF